MPQREACGTFAGGGDSRLSAAPRLGILEPLGQHTDAFDAIVPDFDVVSGQLGETRKPAEHVE